jgi:phosphoserine phosphatase
MSHVITLVGGADLAPAVSLAAGVAARLGARILGEAEVSPGEARDLQVEAADGAALAQALIDPLDGLAVDWAVQPAAGRRKALLIADMDSTIIGQECIDELADLAGVGEAVSAITERAMRGELDFEGALTERVAMIAGLPLGALQRCFDERVSLNPGARALLATMRAHGAHTALVSGGFTFFTSRVAQAAGFDEHQANVLLDDGAALTGAVARPILGREAKREALMRLAAARGLEPQDAMAIGDGANDLAMLTAAGLGVAYRAKPVVAAQAHARITHGTLVSALFFQGYSRADFVG